MSQRVQSRGLRGVFSSFSSPGYPMLWWAGLFSFLSVQMQILVRGILAWDLTLRESALGLSYLCFGLALLVATPLGGVASDQLSKRTVMLVSQGAMAIAATTMGIMVITGLVQFWMLLIAAVVQGLAFGFFGPARMAIASELVGRDQLGNAITLSLLSMNGTRVFAPAVAGTLAGVVFIGIGGTYIIAAVISLVGFGFLLRLPRTAPTAVAPATAVLNGSSPSAPSTALQNGSAEPSMNGSTPSANGSAPRRPRRQVHALEEIVEGVRYVLARPPLRRMVLTSFFVIMFGFNYMAFYPALVKGVFGLGDQWVGYISSASAIGAVGVALPLASRADSVWAKATMALAGIAFGVTVLMLGLSTNFWMAFVVVAFVGAAVTVFQSLSNTLALAMTDDDHQGRVQSLMQLSFAGFGIAALPLGGLAELIGLRNTISVMGALAAVTSLLYVLREGGWSGLKPDLQGLDPAGAGVSVDNVATDTVDPVDAVEDDVDLVGSPASRA